MTSPWILVLALALWALWQTLRTDALTRRVRDAERMIVELADMIEARDPARADALILDQAAAARARAIAPRPPLTQAIESGLASPHVSVPFAWAASVGALLVFAFALHPIWGPIRIAAKPGDFYLALIVAYIAGAAIGAAAMRIGARHDDIPIRTAGAATLVAFGFCALSLTAFYLMRGAEMLSPYAPTPAHMRAISLLAIGYGAFVWLAGRTAQSQALRIVGRWLLIGAAIKFAVFDAPGEDGGLRAFLFLVVVITLTWAAFAQKPARRRMMLQPA
ncbi:MAG: DUF2339 domain-containing protein [Alphaproteobacteria bacterium]|nr:DUF2339 domain-containing protein [Alphaproteobacteria bacterium]